MVESLGPGKGRGEGIAVGEALVHNELHRVVIGVRAGTSAADSLGQAVLLVIGTVAQNVSRSKIRRVDVGIPRQIGPFVSDVGEGNPQVPAEQAFHREIPLIDVLGLGVGRIIEYAHARRRLQMAR